MLLSFFLVKGLFLALLFVPARGLCKNRTARLHNGFHYFIGRAQICINGHWFDICGQSWGRSKSDELCNLLGYSETDGYVPGDLSDLEFRDSSMLSIICDGNELNLSECHITKISRNDCHLGPVTVYCKATPAFDTFDETHPFWRLVQLGEIALVIIGFTVWLFKKCWNCCCCKCCPCKKDERDEFERPHYRHERHQMKNNGTHRSRQRQHVRTNDGFQQGAIVQHVY